jgi:signal transduction histidine kinase/CheY-like chemotaxis protein
MVPSSPAAQTQEITQSKLHLLLVVEVARDIEQIVNTLVSAGVGVTYEVTVTPQHCQQLLAKNSYDAVLSAYKLTALSSFEALSLVQQSGQNYPFILVTDALGDEAAVECIKAGMTNYVLLERLFRLPEILRRSLLEVAQRRQQQLEASHLGYAVQHQARQERSLNQISRTLNSLNPDHILQEVVRLTGECFRVDRAIIFSLKGEKIRVLNEWRANEQVYSMKEFQAPLSAWPDLVEPNSAFFRRQCFHAPNYAELPLTPTRLQHIEEGQICSVLSTPIFIREQFFGGLALHTTTDYRTFTADEIRLLEQIIDQAAIALYNAQSYEHLEQVIQERTKELEQEKQSLAASRSKTEFLATMSHELRTPLTGILGFSRLLLDQVFGSLNDEQLEYIDAINSCGEHLLELINDLLDLSKVEAGQEELVLETIPVQGICQTSISVVQERAFKQNLILILDIAPDITTYVADHQRCKQILVNLLSNAVKFTPSGSVKLKVEQFADTIQFSVIDTGIGISKENQKSLFQPFQQLDSGLNRQYEGTGLGLALSLKLAQLHGGNITVSSELGRGSCFTLHLPHQRPNPSGDLLTASPI